MFIFLSPATANQTTAQFYFFIALITVCNNCLSLFLYLFIFHLNLLDDKFLKDRNRFYYFSHSFMPDTQDRARHRGGTHQRFLEWVSKLVKMPKKTISRGSKVALCVVA